MIMKIINMLFFICLCSCWTIIIPPVLSLESDINAKCTENGECMDKPAKFNLDNGDNSNNGTNNALMTFYEVTDDFGNKFNISDIKILLSTLTEKSHNYDKIQKDVAFVFQGVVAAVILFGICATICVCSACIYCCRINTTDNRLKNDVEALAEKLKRDCRFRKTFKKPQLEPISESCNIINADAGVFCV